MYYYVVNKIGDGTRGNPFRPDIPENVKYVWSDNACDTCETFLLSSDTEIEGLIQVTDLNTTSVSRNLSLSDVKKWFVGG